MIQINENRRIGRRIYQTTCHCITYDENNNRVEFDTTFTGQVASVNRAASRVQKELKLKNVLVTDFETTSHFYSMLAEDFIKHADQITD